MVKENLYWKNRDCCYCDGAFSPAFRRRSGSLRIQLQSVEFDDAKNTSNSWKEA
jgi:hypothetical protein